jgi:hypothetical protein
MAKEIAGFSLRTKNEHMKSPRAAAHSARMTILGIPYGK